MRLGERSCSLRVMRCRKMETTLSRLVVSSLAISADDTTRKLHWKAGTDFKSAG
jgi:hypothetical protein